MMKLAIVFTLVVAFTAAASPIDAFEADAARRKAVAAFHEIREMLPGLKANALRTLHTSHTTVRDAGEMAANAIVNHRSAEPEDVSSCQTAISGLASTFNSTCLAEYVSLLSPSSTDFASDDKYAAYCDGGCGAAVSAAIDNVKTECAGLTGEDFGGSGTLDSLFAAFETLKAYIRIPCVKSGNTFCYPAFFRATGEAGALSNLGGDTVPSQETMQSLCHPCFGKVFRLAVSFGVGSAEAQLGAFEEALGLLCLKNGDTFCLPTAMSYFQNNQNAFQNSDSIDSFNDVLSDICGDPCIGGFIRKTLAYASSASSSAVDSIFDAIFSCRIGSDGGLCVTKSINEIQSIGQSCTGTVSCDANCKSAIEGGLSAVTECCVDTFVTWVSFITGDDEAGIVQFITGTCGITEPDECTEVTAVDAMLAISNLKDTYYDATRDKAQIEAAFEQQYGLPGGSVVVTPGSSSAATSQQAGTSSTMFTVRLDTGNDPANNAIVSSAIRSDITNDNLPVGQLTRAPPSGRDEPTDDVEVDAESSSSTTEGPVTNGAATAKIAPLAMLVAAVAFATLF